MSVSQHSREMDPGVSHSYSIFFSLFLFVFKQPYKQKAEQVLINSRPWNPKIVSAFY